ncbi:hypothetical protein [Candidatus Viridilinea mediisalina]|uniref:Uncharacterized protein n=1 Tax=Candidatus Viridilinea mediisalina TaxID=2024553 RepID=A0A2A6RFA5_9CHLR|nr:hypothetical protein [Candidatus Viridilinea mediisalina]PDW01566.1 hypothetical protein CJ255_18485 [Candidatus Viridilinea mediisalina]
MKFTRSGKFLIAPFLVLSLLLASVAVSHVNADEHGAAMDATITVHLRDLGLEFGAVTTWEASLYAGAEVGAETGGRFSEWKPVEDGTVVFSLPAEVSEGSVAPWGAEDDTYVRVRARGDDVYPTFDLVSNPFTLVGGAYAVELALSATPVNTEVRVRLRDLGAEFGTVGAWEASLYAGAVAGSETGGRFTAWKPAEDGVVSFTLPSEVSEGNEAPWGTANDTYVRVRQVGDDVYPTFDLVGRPFTLEPGINVETHVELGRSVATPPEPAPEPVMLNVDEHSATVAVNLTDLGLEFGAVHTWEASLYAGAVAGEETDGRFSDWKAPEDGVVLFTLPAEVREGSVAPWGAEDNTYLRVRARGDDVYPTFDWVSNPFTLNSGAYTATMSIASVALRDTVVRVTMDNLGEAFGQIGTWEASLYAGAEAGSETGGRFTEWKAPEYGAVTFVLPAEMRAGNVAPWGVEDDTYVRVRARGDDVFPTFDLVGRPFTLQEGHNLESNVALSSAVVSETVQVALAEFITSTVTINVEDLGLPFGAVQTWEASLYAGAEAGAETGGRFTAWKPVAEGLVSFSLPSEIDEGEVAPWGEAQNTYIRIRARGDDVYPTFDWVSVPFTLDQSTNYTATMRLTSDAMHYTLVNIILANHGAAFGAFGAWEASLYAGAEAGAEQDGRFTAWKAATDGMVSFAIPHEVSAGNEAPWGEENGTYVRFRNVSVEDAEVYPTFDMVGAPFTLTRGPSMTTQLNLSRTVSHESAETPRYTVYLPLVVRE